MLAVVMYTGCDCTYAMCEAERDGDFETWRVFSSLLGTAVDALSKRDIDHRIYSSYPDWGEEGGPTSLYSGEQFFLPRSVPPKTSMNVSVSPSVGIPKVRLNDRDICHEKQIHRFLRFITHVSTSRDRGLAERFMGKEGGLLIEFQTHLNMGDVSWISKFPDEREVLYAAGGIRFYLRKNRDGGYVETIGNVQHIVVTMKHSACDIK